MTIPLRFTEKRGDRMKKTLSLLLSVVLLLSAIILPVSAESADAFTVSVDTVNSAQA